MAEIKFYPPPTLEQIVERHVSGDSAALLSDLNDREDKIGEFLCLMADTYGLFVQIVSFNVMMIGLGRSPDEATRTYIEQQYRDLMQRLEDQ